MSRRILSTLNLPVSCSPSFGMTATAQTACVCPARVITDFPSNQTRAVLGKKESFYIDLLLSLDLTDLSQEPDRRLPNFPDDSVHTLSA